MPVFLSELLKQLSNLFLEPIRKSPLVIYPEWYKIAMKEIGTTEYRGTLNNTRILEYHKATKLKATSDSVPWCASFVSWCLGKHGLQTARAKDYLHWGVDLLDKPKLGCIVILSRASAGNPFGGHVGFFAKENEDFIWLLGGNQDNEVGVNPYKKSRLLGYRWPI